MKNIIAIATQDGHWLARCAISGRVASGHTKSHAISNLNQLIQEGQHYA